MTFRKRHKKIPGISTVGEIQEKIVMKGIYHMKEQFARELFPVWASGDDAPVRIVGEQKEPPKIPTRMRMEEIGNRLIKRYGIFLAVMAVWTISLIICSAIVHHNTAESVMEQMEEEYAVMLEQYKREQAEAEQAQHWLSGQASLDAAINQEVDAVAAVIAKLSTDAQKLTEASCMLARVMSPAYPNSFQEVAQQAQQWMFYTADGDNTFSQHDRDLAEQIVRPYMEEGIIPNGLTADMVYGEWTPNDFVLRDSYLTTSQMRTWRWQ